MNENEAYILYGRKSPPCVFCERAIELLNKHDKTFSFEDISDPDTYAFVVRQGWKTVPQIEFWGKDNKIVYIGGYEQLKEHLKKEDNNG